MQGFPFACLPVDSLRLTAVPGATWAPPPGFWVRTSPAASVQFGVIVTDPTESPAPVIAARALPSSKSSTFGTVTRAGASHTVRRTGVPNGSRSPGARSEPTILPRLATGQLVV